MAVLPGIQRGYNVTHSRLDEFISFGDWVRRRRKTLDLTQADLARRIGCVAVTIKKIEREERRPSPEMAQLLADHLAIPQARRADFMRLARGQFAVASPEALPPPRFLLSGLPPTQAAPSRFVARAAELAWLEAHLKLALAGQGRVVFISGEAGEGKTGLMAEFARRAQAAQPDLVVAGGNCNAQTGPGDPYLPFRDGLSMLTGDLETRWLAGDISSEQVLQLWALLPHTIEIILEHGPDLIDRLIPGAALIQRLAVYAPGRADWLDRLQSLARQPQARPAALAVTPEALEPGDNTA